MPEYSSTTITPSDGVQVPSMSGSTSGNFLLSALKSYILAEKGQANGLASLGSDGKLTAAQLPDLADDVIVVASYAVLPAAGTAGKIYITADNNKLYRWDPDLTTPNYVELSVDLSAYATKAELAEEESAREAADSNLKSAIQGNTARIENLEQEHGGYVPVNYRGTNAVPTGKAKYALVESIVGKSRAWNQLVKNDAFDGGYNWYENGVNYSASDNVATIEGTSYPNGSVNCYSGQQIIAGHKYLLCITAKADANMNFGFGLGGVFSTTYFTASTSWELKIVIVTASTSSSNDVYYIYNTTSSTLQVKKFFLRDLTLIFPDLPSTDLVTSNIPALVKRCPDLLKYDAYGTSIVDTTVEGVRSRGFNLWDEVYEEGDINYTSGLPVDNSNYIRSVNFCEVTANTSIYVKANNTIWVLWYDADYGYIGGSGVSGNVGGTTVTSPPNARFFKLVNRKISFDGKICINVSDSQDGTYTPYWSPVTLSLPTPITLRSAGTVAEVYDLETGEKTNPLGSYTFTGNETWEQYTDWGSSITWKIAVAYLPNELKQAVDGWSGEQLFPLYLSGTVSEVLGGTKNMSCILNGTSGFYICDSSITSASDCQSKTSGRTINFKLATPDDPTQLTPVIDNTILTEGGGTINTIQTQTTKIDNCLDVGYLAL